MRIDRSEAAKIFRTQWLRSEHAPGASKWNKKIERFSQLCDEGGTKTHIAFLGTSLLAKAVELDVDLYAIKPKHAPGNPRAYSARSLCHTVLVPLSAELGVDIGVSGREPLNNQPYFRMKRLDDGTPIHGSGREAFEYMLQLIKDISEISSEAEAMNALLAFISVRRQYQVVYDIGEGAAGVLPEMLPEFIATLTISYPEGGRVAQAVVAGLLDAFSAYELVDCGRINDPSRNYPGDVCIRSANSPELIEKSFEVRDKPVSLSDVYIFGKKCRVMNVEEAAVVMVSPRQAKLDQKEVSEWASRHGLGVTLFHGWSDLVEQVLFWSKMPKIEVAKVAVKRIQQRLIEAEASPSAVKKWTSLSRGS